MQLDLALPLAAFVVLEVWAVTLSDHLVALGWGTPGRNASAYVFSSGVMDTQTVLNYCVAVEVFRDTAATHFPKWGIFKSGTRQNLRVDL